MPRPEIVHPQQQKQFEALIPTNDGLVRFQWYVADVGRIRRDEKQTSTDQQVTLFYPHLPKTIQEIVTTSSFKDLTHERLGEPAETIRASTIALGSYSYIAFFETGARGQPDYFIAHLSRAKTTTELGQIVANDAKALHTAAEGLRNIPESALNRFHIAEPFWENVTEKGYSFYLQPFINGEQLALDALDIPLPKENRNVHLPYMTGLDPIRSNVTKLNVIAELRERDKRPAKSFEEVVAASETYAHEKSKLAHLLKGYAFIYASTGGLAPLNMHITGGTHLVENMEKDPDITVVSFEGPLEFMTPDEWSAAMVNHEELSPSRPGYILRPFSRFSLRDTRRILDKALKTV